VVLHEVVLTRSRQSTSGVGGSNPVHSADDFLASILADHNGLLQADPRAGLVQISIGRWGNGGKSRFGNESEHVSTGQVRKLSWTAVIPSSCRISVEVRRGRSRSELNFAPSVRSLVGQ
jgi:hypothetical protein